MSTVSIILAEDEPSLGMIVKESLESRNFQVTLCKNGEEALMAYEKEKPDALVLDIMMPKKDGFMVAQAVRKQDPFIPIIFLTAKSRTEDVVEGFGYGANDYIKKPFSMEELIVRIKALVNRAEKPQLNEWISLGKYRFHLQKQLLQFNEEEECLTHREAQLLHELIQHKNDLTDRSLILKKLWGSDDFFNARSMDVFISKLRKKLDKDPNIQIVNVRGYGYKLIL
ncbi:response regulator transcription factor [Marivirga atlantica]|jgi:DNA-binding response OmpR family regulator|uniref:Response regulator transcription factor n=1 Tax=Marivirga atlantica TaxID=1548457 RepID=A0A937DID6_9BACT|nr:response regulator transcription factor [Marivirga atlantica]MBL0764061.1 response regulator transcription factor [Marivirga atlantica]